MSDSGPKTTVSTSPFWRFSVAFYAVPAVAAACIELQDQAKVDVNILFFLLWNATQNRALSADDVSRIEHAIGPWRDVAVVPLRTVRRALKTPPPVMTPDKAQSLRSRVQAAELEAERLQQETLYDIATVNRIGQSVANPVEAARASISAYQGVIGPFPPGPLDTVLSAFANFKMPARDTKE